jgi:hypothetical protein
VSEIQKTGIQSRGNTLDHESEPRITEGTKRGAENPKKEKNIAFTKKVRTRSQQNSEGIYQNHVRRTNQTC